MPYNPGVVDVSGQIKAQAFSSGINSLTQGMSAGIARWEQNKEQDKAMLGIIKSAEIMAKGFGEVAESLDPRLAKAIEGMRTSISDPNLSTRERAMAAESFSKQIPLLMNTGVATMQERAQQEQQKQVAMAKAAEMQQKQMLAQEEMIVDQLSDSIALNQTLPQGIPQGLLNRATVKAAEKRNKGQMTTRDVDEFGNPIQVTTNVDGKVTKSPINQPQMVRSPQEDARAASLVAVAKADADTMVNYQTSSRSAGTRLAQTNRAIELIETTKTNTGVAEPVLQSLRRAYVQFGGDEKLAGKTGDFGELTNLMSNQLLDYFAKTKGAISDFETKRFMEFSANTSKTPEENLRILRASQQVLERETKIGGLINKLRKEGKEPAEIVESVDAYIEANPINFSEPAPSKAKAPAAQVAAPAQPAPVAPSASPATGGFRWNSKTQRLEPR